MRVSSRVSHVPSQKNWIQQSQTPSLKVEVMVKQIWAVFSSGTEQFVFWVGICLGLNDTSALTTTIGLDLRKGHERTSECHQNISSLPHLFCSRTETWIVVTCSYLSKTTVPFDPTAKSGSLSPLRSNDDWLMDTPKNFSPGLTSWAEILCTNRRVIYLAINTGGADGSGVSSIQLFFLMKQATEEWREINMFNRKKPLAHLWVSWTDSSSAFAMKYVDAPLGVILQRRSDGQVVKAVSVKIRQYSKRGPKPPCTGCRTAQKISLEIKCLVKE